VLEDADLAAASPPPPPAAPPGALRRRLDAGALEEDLQHDPLRLHKVGWPGCVVGCVHGAAPHVGLRVRRAGAAQTVRAAASKAGLSGLTMPSLPAPRWTRR